MWLTIIVIIIVFAMFKIFSSLYLVKILYFHDKKEETERNGDINKYPVINKNNPLSTCHIVKGEI